MLGLPQTPVGTGLPTTADDNSINGCDCLEFDGCRRSEGNGSGRTEDDKDVTDDRVESKGWLKTTGNMFGLGTVWHCKIWLLICTTLLLHSPVW